jgi:hypothetical protein
MTQTHEAPDHSLILPDDEHFHDVNTWPGYDPKGLEWFNESGLFMFAVPERNLSAWVYVQHRPNMGFTWCGMAVWDTSGSLTTDCLHYNFMYYVTPPGSEVWDFHIPKAGLTIKAPKPLQTYQFSYDKEGLRAELEFNAFHPPVGQEVPDTWTDWCPRHYDHVGRMTGELVIGGERIPVDSFCCRDRSWGPHRKDKLARGSYMWGVAAENHAFIGYVLSDLGFGEDPFVGTTEAVKGGWYMKDGKVGAIISGERTAERDAEDTRPTREIVEAKDEYGRVFTAEGNAKNHLLFTGFPEYPWWWTSVDWRLDGVPAVGETQDAATIAVFRRAMRARAARRATA